MGVKILSLYDGMACGMIAMQLAGVEVESYDAYEIDKYAIKTAQHNFPMIKEHGDVFDADFTQYEGVDFLIGGSPCTYWSIAQTKNRETVASGMGWELFSQYVRALHEAKPRFFLYENNKSMSAAIRASITEMFGFEPILINSALVSAQNRQRLYWCGIRQADGTYKRADIQQPADRGILLKDILETKAAEPVCIAQRGRYDESGKVYQHYEAQPTGKTNNLTTVSKDNLIAEPICVNSKSGRAGVEGLQPSLQDRVYDTAGKMPAVTTSFNPRIAEPVKLGEIGKGGQGNRVYSIDGKAVAQTAQSGGMGRNTGLYAEPLKVCEATNAPIYEVKDGYITVKGNKYPIKLVDGFYIIRKLTVRECMRLQTVPEWYEWPMSKSQAYKMLGNGWTVEVIAHLLRGLK